MLLKLLRRLVAHCRFLERLHLLGGFLVLIYNLLIVWLFEFVL